MKPESQSKTIKTARGFKWGGILAVAAAVVTFLLDGLDTLPIAEEASIWAKYVLGAGATAISAGVAFRRLRLVTHEGVAEGQ